MMTQIIGLLRYLFWRTFIPIIPIPSLVPFSLSPLKTDLRPQTPLVFPSVATLIKPLSDPHHCSFLCAVSWGRWQSLTCWDSRSYGFYPKTPSCAWAVTQFIFLDGPRLPLPCSHSGNRSIPLSCKWAISPKLSKLHLFPGFLSSLSESHSHARLKQGISLTTAATSGLLLGVAMSQTLSFPSNAHSNITSSHFFSSELPSFLFYLSLMNLSLFAILHSIIYLSVCLSTYLLSIFSIDTEAIRSINGKLFPSGQKNGIWVLWMET